MDTEKDEQVEVHNTSIMLLLLNCFDNFTMFLCF